MRFAQGNGVPPIRNRSRGGARRVDARAASRSMSIPNPVNGYALRQFIDTLKIATYGFVPLEGSWQ
jgi:hypothetical protein